VTPHQAIGEALALVFAPAPDPLPPSFAELLDCLEALDRRGEPAPGILSDAAFRHELEAALPDLRGYARSLTRKAEEADDLVQETMLKAWSKRHLFQAGTNFRAWSFTIERNLFMSEMRRARFRGEWDEQRASARLTTPAPQEHRMHLGDLIGALDEINPDQRDALLLVSVGDMSYDEAAEATGTKVGTIKSRVARARTALGVLLDAEQVEARVSIAIERHEAEQQARADV